MSKERELYHIWLEHLRGDAEYAGELERIGGDDAEITDRFYRDLEFGTAGLRGVLGLGTNRMNVFTVARATQGLADWLLAEYTSPSAAIAYDSRICSDVFAREAARVLAANGVKVHLFAELMPTPALSWAVRELGCQTGIVITASHNPAKYNGYKAYGPDGSQLGPEQSATVLGNILKTDLFGGVRRVDFDGALASGKIEYIPDSMVERFFARVFEEAIDPAACAEAGLRLVYTPLNGAGLRGVRTVLQRAGVTDFTVVPEQEHPDGNFPTCPSPNPEMRETLTLGLALAEKTDADMLLATDPDADRVAVAVRGGGGEYRVLTGNEAGVLLLDYICAARQKKSAMPARPVAVKSIVSTKLADAVANGYGVELKSVLTGFKFIGEVITGLESSSEADRFILGFEESCGYLSGCYARDKDAIGASLLLVEMASALKLAGKTPADRLDEIYAQYGVYLNRVASFSFEGADGMRKMAGIMEKLRKSPPSAIGGVAVTSAVDYQNDATGLPRSDVLEYLLENGCSVIVRPSGTEPKMKVYLSLMAKTQPEAETLAATLGADCAKMME